MSHREKSNLTLEQRVRNIEAWAKWLPRAAGITLAGILAFAFWLGTISAKVSSSEQTINKVYDAVLESPNSLTVRTNLIEYRLTGVEDRLTKVENKISSMDTKLNEIVMRLDRIERKIR